MEQKMYYKHTTRPGKGFKQMNMQRVFEKLGGGEVLRRAVSGMLPKNRLRDVRLARLKGKTPKFRPIFMPPFRFSCSDEQKY